MKRAGFLTKLQPQVRAIEEVPVAAMCVLVVDADFTTVRWQRAHGQKFAVHFIGTGPACKPNNNRFRPLTLEDWQGIAATVAQPSARATTSHEFLFPALSSPVQSVQEEMAGMAYSGFDRAC